MGSTDTEMGGPDRSFRTTIWSDILAAGNPDDPASRESLDRLLKAYWKPVFAYIRSAWKAPVEEAKDLTQSFFARFLEKEYWSRLQPDQGSFRGYLKRALKHFLINAREREEVRRPAGRLFSLDAAPGELERLAAAPPEETPERTYDREWFNCLMDASFAELKESLEREGRRTHYEIFQAYCLEGGGAADDAPTYEKIAGRLGLQKHDVRNQLAYARKRLKEIVRGRIREYAAGEGDLERELAEAIRG